MVDLLSSRYTGVMATISLRRRPDLAIPAVRRWRWALLSCLLILYAALSLALQVDQVTQWPASHTTFASRHCDFVAFLDSARQVLDGRPLYKPRQLFPDSAGVLRPLPNLNPPALTVLLLPLTIFSTETAYVLWLAASALACGVACVAVWREYRPQIPIGGYLALAAAAVAFPGWVFTLVLGQVSYLLAAVVVGAWLAWRRRCLFLAGCLMGILIVWKPFLLPLAALVAASRSWRQVAGLAAGGLAMVMVGLPVAGLVTYREWVASLGGLDPGGLAANAWNISLLAGVERIAGVTFAAPVVRLLPFALRRWC